jgi:3-oxoacyl-[acyl-carrier-protein] synthase III
MTEVCARSTRRYLSAVTYTTGTRRPLDALVSEGVLEPSTCGALHAAGVRHFLEDTRPSEEMWTAAAEGCLRAHGVAGEDVDATVIVCFESESRAAFRGLAAAGCRRALMLTISLQDCGGISAALRVASALIDGITVNTVLVVACARCRCARDRIEPRLKIVLGDGAVACLVSADTGAFEILSSYSLTQMSQAAVWGSGTGAAPSLAASVDLMRTVVGAACRLANTDLSGISVAFCSSPNRELLLFMCHAIRLPVDKIYEQTLIDHGHVFCCDSLIGLQDYTERQKPPSGERFLLYSWAPLGVGATVLQYGAPAVLEPPLSRRRPHP